jgi:hypothetical protein
VRVCAFVVTSVSRLAAADLFCNRLSRDLRKVVEPESIVNESVGSSSLPNDILFLIFRMRFFFSLPV